MTPPSVRLLPEAVEDLLETQRWYCRLEPVLARDFAEAFAAAVERIHLETEQRQARPPCQRVIAFARPHCLACLRLAGVK